MKTSLKFFVIVLALFMQVSIVCAYEGTPVYLYSLRTPKTGNIAGPRRTAAKPRPLYMDIFLDEDNRCLNLSDPEGNTITYYIYNEDEQVVASGTISFAEQETATISLETLGYGLYTLNIILDDTTYSGDFGLEE